MPNPNYIANGNIYPSRFVKTDTTADHKVLQAGANERIAGISQEGGREAPLPSVTMYAAQQYDSLNVYGEGDECLLELGGTVAAGDLLKADADGKGVAAATTGTTAQEVGARALTAGSSGDKIRVQVHLIPKLYPALA